MTPLHKALLRRDIEIVKLLMEYEAKTENIVNMTQFTVVYYLI